MTAIAPGIYHGLSYEEYDAIKALRASVAYDYYELTASKARYNELNPDDSSRQAERGIAAHAWWLEGEKRFSVIEVEHSKTSELCTNYGTKAAREARDAAKEAGLVPLFQHELEDIMTAATRLEGARIIDRKTGDPEAVVVWDDPLGIRCKQRIDWLWRDCKRRLDLKTTGRTQEDWLDYEMPEKPAFQMAFAQRAPQLAGCEAEWLVQDQKAPFDFFLAGMDAQSWDMANEAVETAIRKYVQCLKAQDWPGYPRGKFIGTASPRAVARHQAKQHYHQYFGDAA